MSENEKELREEVERLRDMVKQIDRKYEKRSAVIQFTSRDGRLGLIVTCPSTLDEMDFGRYVASTMALMVQGLAKVGAAEPIAHTPDGEAARKE